MKIAIPDGDGGFYTFTNEDLKVGDKVFPIVHGWRHNGQWYLTDVSFRGDDAMSTFACTGWRKNEKLREPHTIKDFYMEDGLQCVHTDHGYSPAKVYFKLIEHIASNMPSCVECSECRFDETCKIKKNKKAGGGCSFYGKRK